MSKIKFHHRSYFLHTYRPKTTEKTYDRIEKRVHLTKFNTRRCFWLARILDEKLYKSPQIKFPDRQILAYVISFIERELLTNERPQRSNSFRFDDRLR